MITQPQWTLMDSYPVTVPDKTIPTAQTHTTQPQPLSGALHLEQPLTPPAQTSDPHLKLSIELPEETDLFLTKHAVKQLYDLLTIATDPPTDLQCQIPTMTPAETQHNLNCVITPMPAQQTPPDVFVLAFERRTNPTLVLTLEPPALNTFITHLETALD